MPSLVGFSPSASSALIAPEFTALAMAESFAPGSFSNSKINRAPVVFGFRSPLNKISSLSPRRGTMSM